MCVDDAHTASCLVSLPTLVLLLLSSDCLSVSVRERKTVSTHKSCFPFSPPLACLSAVVAFVAAGAVVVVVNAQFDGYEIRKGKQLKVNVSVPNLRLFVGNIPKSKSKAEILSEFSKLTSESSSRSA